MIRKGDQTLEMTSQMRYLISEKNEEMASEGLRVLAIAEAKRDQIEQLHERDLTFLGLLGLMDSREKMQRIRSSVPSCRDYSCHDNWRSFHDGAGYCNGTGHL